MFIHTRFRSCGGSIALLSLLVFTLAPAIGRADGGVGGRGRRKGSIFLSWGYNRSGYAASDIHFTGPEYDFTLHDVDAVDRPSALNAKIYLNPSELTIPQYVARVGYYFTERTSVSIGLIHLKYVAVPDQGTTISGRIGDGTSEEYAGEYDNTPISMDESLLRFEHTNGLNYASVEVERLFPLWQSGAGSSGLYAIAGGGGGVVVPVSDVTLFDERRSNATHRAGYGFSASGGFINLNDILTRSGGGGDRAKQHIYFREGAIVGGVTLLRIG